MTRVAITAAHSFRVLEGLREVATLTTGRGILPTGGPSCFVAVRQGLRVSLAPTIGQGMFEAVTCGAPVAVGILSSTDTVRIGALFRAYSPNAGGTEPVVLAWNRADGTLAIDEAASRRVSEAGAQSIAAMRRAAGRPAAAEHEQGGSI